MKAIGRNDASKMHKLVEDPDVLTIYINKNSVIVGQIKNLGFIGIYPQSLPPSPNPESCPGGRARTKKT